MVPIPQSGPRGGRKSIPGTTNQPKLQFTSKCPKESYPPAFIKCEPETSEPTRDWQFSKGRQKARGARPCPVTPQHRGNAGCRSPGGSPSLRPRNSAGPSGPSGPSTRPPLREAARNKPGFRSGVASRSASVSSAAHGPQRRGREDLGCGLPEWPPARKLRRLTWPAAAANPQGQASLTKLLPHHTPQFPFSILGKEPSPLFLFFYSPLFLKHLFKKSLF
jgi:hypothetical protein